MTDELQLRISVTIYQQRTGGNLQVQEEMQLKPKTFVELCAILGRFQELADNVKRGDK